MLAWTIVARFGELEVDLVTNIIVNDYGIGWNHRYLASCIAWKNGYSSILISQRRKSISNIACE
jgi:hypothetical protein